MIDKKEVRKKIRNLRENLDKEFIKKSSEIIFQKLKNQGIFLKAKTVLSYMDFKNEVETRKINEFIKNNSKILILPKVIDRENMITIKDEGNFSTSPFGNIEPEGKEYTEEIDLIIVPGVAFDKYGNRIGFGRGYYDRFFKKYPKAKRIAIAFDLQIIDEMIETDEYDEKIDMLISEKNIYKF